MTGRLLFVLMLLSPALSRALVIENGTLTGFLMDTCATCAYDNWQSHVSERIQRPGYNDYGPAHLDPQTNGFGGFQYIYANAHGDSIMARWRQVFLCAIHGDWECADSLIARQDSAWNYELARIEEPTGASYYVMRERLDSSYVDVNGDTLTANDVHGGFRRGWGVFVFSAAPRHARAVVQMPHPEDDFMSIPVGIELFQQAEMAILMIAGAGREVMYDSAAGQYNNARTFSDPSRNARHPFSELSRVIKDSWNSPPVNPLVLIQLHSYDHATHGPLPDIQVSCYHNDEFPNAPLRNFVNQRDLFHAHPVFPVTSVDGDDTIDVAVNNYIGLWSNPAYVYTTAETTLTIPVVGDLIGAPDNVVGDYFHAGHDVQRHTENFIHIELDEYPDKLWAPLDWPRWLPGTPPTEWNTYRHALAYYQPFISAVDSALTWHEIPDEEPPLVCNLTSAYDLANGAVTITWDAPAYDRHFDTYQVFFDTNEVSLSSPHIARTNTGYNALGNMLGTSITVSGLRTPVWDYTFAIRAKDVLGYESELSPALGITDGMVRDVAAFCDGDSVRMTWSAQPNDDRYEVWEFPPGLGGYYYLGTTLTNNFVFVPTGYSGNGVCVLMVKRVIE
ncbi:MAG: hypothetical protein IPK53_01585 [bacterium]|nr:hypothetical protein [bacterium]